MSLANKLAEIKNIQSFVEDDKDDTIDEVNIYFRKKLFQNGIKDYINQNGTMYLGYEMLMTISKAQVQTVERILEEMQNGTNVSFNLPIKTERIDQDAEAKMKKIGERLRKINKPYCLKKMSKLDAEGTGDKDQEKVDNALIHLTDLECIFIGVRLKEIEADPSIDKMVMLPDKKIDLE
jgi:hypothetical protein